MAYSRRICDVFNVYTIVNVNMHTSFKTRWVNIGQLASPNPMFGDYVIGFSVSLYCLNFCVGKLSGT